MLLDKNVTLDLKKILEEFGRDVVAPHVEELYEHGEFDSHAWKVLSTLGFWKITVPSKYGGYERTWQDFATALGYLAHTTGDLGFLLSIIAHAGLLRGIIEFGTEYQKQCFLPRLTSGDVGATALTEASGGSDLASICTTATVIPSGYLFSGSKVHITNAPVADFLLVLGRIPSLGDKQDITLFLMDAHSPGITHSLPEDLLGNRTSPTGSLTFNNVELPSDAVLGIPGKGLETLYKIISLDRVLYGLIIAAYLEPLLHKAMDFAHSRQAFKVPIAEYEYIQGRLTDIKLTIETTRSISHSALDALIAGEQDAMLLCSAAKLIGTEGLVTATRHIMCIHGHEAYMNGPLSRSIRDSLGTLIAGGTSEMQRKNIFHQMVEHHQEKAV